MEIKEMKTKVKVGFPEESEIFMAEEFLEELSKVSLKDKPVEMDLSGVQTLDTVFFQIAVSIIQTVAESNNKITLKSSEALENAEALYGIKLSEMVSGGN